MSEKKKIDNKAELVEIVALKNKNGHMVEGKTYEVGHETAKLLVDKKAAKFVTK